MDYTLSNSYDIEPATSQRMHEDSKAIPTVWSDLDANSIIWGLMEIVKAAGLPGLQFNKATPETYRVLLKALRSNALLAGIDTGVANTAVVPFTPPIDALSDNMVVWFKAIATNTGPATLNVSATGAKPIVGGAHSTLQGGEITAGGVCQVVWRAGANSWVLLKCTGAPVQIPAATQSGHATNLSQLGLRGLVALTASGNFTVPAGVYVLDVHGWGGGGGGGGSGGGGGTAGGGGGAGYARKRIAVTPGQVIAYVVGAGGPGGGAGGSGFTGSATSFGAFFTAQPGTGGTLNPSGNAGPPGGAVGGDVNMTGGSGGTGSASNVQGGSGGSAAGGGGGSGGAQGNASAGGFPGGGGGGGGSAASGGSGGAGLIVVSY